VSGLNSCNKSVIEIPVSKRILFQFGEVKKLEFEDKVGSVGVDFDEFIGALADAHYLLVIGEADKAKEILEHCINTLVTARDVKCGDPAGVRGVSGSCTHPDPYNFFCKGNETTNDQPSYCDVCRFNGEEK